MMNILDMQNSLKGLSDQQLVKEMQTPTGQVPQYLVLSELTRRKDMRGEYQKRMADSGKTVAENAIAAAGLSSGGIASIAQGMAPRTDMSRNDAAPMMGQAPSPVPPNPMAEMQRPMQTMQRGGIVGFRRMASGGPVDHYTMDGEGFYAPRNPMDYQSEKQQKQLENEMMRWNEERWRSPFSPMGEPYMDRENTQGADIHRPEIVIRMAGGGPVGYQSYRSVTRRPMLDPFGQQEWDRLYGDTHNPDGSAKVQLPPTQTISPNYKIPQGADTPPDGIGFGPSPHSDKPVVPSDSLSQFLGGELYRERMFSPSLSAQDGVVNPQSAPAGRKRSEAHVQTETDNPFADLIRPAGPSMRYGNRGTPVPENPDNRIPRPDPEGKNAAAEWEKLSAIMSAQDARAMQSVPISRTASDYAIGNSTSPSENQVIANPSSGNGGGGSGGSSGGGGVSNSGYGSYEQFIQGQLDDLSKQKNRDKWMSLALAGAQLMASSNPSFGGAIGEAFQTGLGAYQNFMSKADEEEMALMETKFRLAGMKASEARAAAGSAMAARNKVATMPSSTANVYLREEMDVRQSLNDTLDTLDAGGTYNQDTGFIPLEPEQKNALEKKAGNLGKYLQELKTARGGYSFDARDTDTTE